MKRILCFIILFCLTFENAYAITESDREFLEKVQRDAFLYFVAHTSSRTGLTADSSRSGAPASIAATGFALASFAIGTKHGWLSYREAYDRILTTLRTLERDRTHHNGFFYHYLDSENAKRIWNSEVSSVDTALLVAGALLAASYFPGTEVATRARQIYERVNWDWMRNDTLLFNHGWRPNGGFLHYYWDIYSEHLIIEALALGSTSHPVPHEVWEGWERRREVYNEKEIIHSYSGSLFTYQYAHAFIDFAMLDDKGENYFENSIKAALANQEFCASLAEGFKSYQNNFWGLSASLGPDGYRAYGAPPGETYHDGTIATHGIIASINFTPDRAVETIQRIYELYGNRLYGEFGFKGSFNLDEDWWADEYLGIDQGVIILMIENFLNEGAVWRRFMNLKPIQRWIERTELLSVAPSAGTNLKLLST